MPAIKRELRRIPGLGNMDAIDDTSLRISLLLLELDDHAAPDARREAELAQLFSIGEAQQKEAGG